MRDLQQRTLGEGDWIFVYAADRQRRTVRGRLMLVRFPDDEVGDVPMVDTGSRVFALDARAVIVSGASGETVYRPDMNQRLAPGLRVALSEMPDWPAIGERLARSA